MLKPDGGEVLCTQYDARSLEQAGMVKYDFLGLKHLQMFRVCLDLIRMNRGEDVDLDAIPDDDAATFEVFSRGDTDWAFQFESPGVRKWLTALKPGSFAELIALNAMYRSGLLDFIPDYVARKHGQQLEEGIHPLMQECLSETFGIFIYQEQLMTISRRIAGFSRGDSDKLRKVLSKGQGRFAAIFKERFIAGCLANSEFRIGEFADDVKARECAETVWKELDIHAPYLFVKSHAVCYAWVAYQGMYLKAHYPDEFAEAIEMCRAPVGD